MNRLPPPAARSHTPASAFRLAAARRQQILFVSRRHYFLTPALRRIDAAAFSGFFISRRPSYAESRH